MLSTIIITKNEENKIVDAIDSVKFSNQIIVVDNESSDRTVELAKRNGAEVISRKFNDFSKQREAGLSEVKSEWILYIDADERVSDNLKDEILSTIGKKESKDVYKLKRQNIFFSKYKWSRLETLERLFRKDVLKGWYGDIHESPVHKGTVGEFSGLLLHYTHSDLSSMTKKTIEWSDVEANLRLESKHPKMAWWRFPRVMIPVFLNYYIKQRGYKLGTAGLIESIFQSYSTFIIYAKLWEMQNKKSTS